MGPSCELLSEASHICLFLEPHATDFGGGGGWATRIRKMPDSWLNVPFGTLERDFTLIHTFRKEKRKTVHA